MAMSGTGILTKAELKAVSGAGTRVGQIAWLEHEGIPWKPNGKEELVVLWVHVQQWVEGRQRPTGRGINWAAC